MTDIEYRRADDWEAVYVDGSLIIQGHCRQILEFFETADYPLVIAEFKTIYENDKTIKWIEERGGYPKDLATIKAVSLRLALEDFVKGK